MVPQRTPQAIPTLRTITYRVTSTPVKQLPRVVPQLAQSLWVCRDLLSWPETQAKDSDTRTLLVRFHTQLSTLLQDRTIEGRWSGTVLLKAALEAGGYEILRKCNNWVRALLAILKKTDPPTTKNLCVITLTRIFLLTRDYPPLLREVTTPALPAFVTTCLSNANSMRCTSSELQTVLESFAHLVSRHPTIFRAQESQLRSLLVNILSASSSDPTDEFHKIYSESHREAARKVFVLLHHCEPKQGASDRWDETLRATVKSAHAVADQIFRSVIEDWQSTAGIVHEPPKAYGEAQQSAVDKLGLSGWQGIYAGSERLVSLLQLIRTHINTATATSVNFCAGAVVDLLTRLFSLTVPSSNKFTAVRPNNQISKDEREALWSVLPSIHVAAFEVTSCLLDRFGSGLLSVLQSLLDQTVWVFDEERSEVSLRIASYMVFLQVLQLIGPSLSKETVASLSPAIRACCADLLPPEASGSAKANALTRGATGIATRLSTNGVDGTGVSAMRTSASIAFPTLHNRAWSLLPMFISKLPTKLVSPQLRALVDKTAVLTQHKQALLASVLNPPVRSDGKGQTSLLPLLARAFPGDPEVEVLLRPRMPVIRTGGKHAPQTQAEGDDPMSEGDTEDRSNAVEGSTVHSDDHLGALESALEQQDAVHGAEPSLGGVAAEQGAEDLYAASPLPGASKRAGEDLAASAPSPKRIRPDQVTETLLLEPAQQLSGSTTAMTSATPQTVFVEQPANHISNFSEVATWPAPASISVTPRMAATSADIDDDDLGSDFEIPPLTMEPSDDEEDEDNTEDD